MTMQLASYLRQLRDAEATLADAYGTAAQGHAGDADVYYICRQLRRQCREHVAALEPVTERYPDTAGPAADHPGPPALRTTHEGGTGLVRDLQELHLLATFADITWTIVGQAEQAVRDRSLLDLVNDCQPETGRQL